MAKANKVPDDAYVVPEPEWSVFMFWQDLSYLFQLIGNFFKKLFGLE